jgi:hypothetical protein
MRGLRRSFSTRGIKENDPPLAAGGGFLLLL